MTAIQLDRTAPFDLIPHTLLSRVGDATAQTITRSVAIPGLTKPGGGLVHVDVTYTLEEIEHDYVGVIVDFAYDCDLRYFGNHPQAEGPLRFLLPDAFPLPDFPKTKREARSQLRQFLGHHNLGGTVSETDLKGSKTLYVTPPLAISDDQQALDDYFAVINEYLPFSAEVLWSKLQGVAAIRVRPYHHEESGS